jgi:lysyl-tRNA synthetase class 2
MPNALMPSAVVRYQRYDPATSRLLIAFQSGRRYVYRGVPQAVAEGFQRAFSKGEYFNDHIRDRFAFERAPDDDYSSAI